MLRSALFAASCAKLAARSPLPARALPSHARTTLLAVSMSSRSGSRKRGGPVKKSSAKKATSSIVPVDEAWVDVRDEASGMTYWWNKQTNETTHLGAPKPLGASAMAPPPAETGQQQQGGMMSGLGGVMAQGMAFGVGSSMAHHAVGAIANSFGGGDDDDGGGGDDGGFDV
jgi:hypothetical protein